MPAPWLHVCIDMQRLFAEPGEWFAPTLLDVVPKVAQLAHHAYSTKNANVFTRFITADSPPQARGTWQGYYTHWQSVCEDALPPGKLDVISALSTYATRQDTHDKTTHSAFNSGSFASWLEASSFATLVLSGVETDVCVLATALDAIDRGYGVVVAGDAVTSSSPAGHEAAMAHVYPRFDQQLRCMTVDAIIDAWPCSQERCND